MRKRASFSSQRTTAVVVVVLALALVLSGLLALDAHIDAREAASFRLPESQRTLLGIDCGGRAVVACAESLAAKARAPKPAAEDWTELARQIHAYAQAYALTAALDAGRAPRGARVAARRAMEAFETRLLPWLASGPQRKLALDVARASQGTGIVIPVGTRSVPRARAAIRVLRAIGCRLPVVIAYFGDGDLAPDARKQLKRLEGVELMDMQPLIATEGIREGWHLKPFAALVAPFRNVLLMDADALFFRPPEELVDMPQFTRTGALLFRDRTLPYGHLGTWGYGLGTLVAQIRKAFGRQPLMLADTRITHLASAVEIDSGVVVWDKMRAMPAIMAACLLNSDPYVTYGANKSHGDKELIWLGHEATRLPVAAGPSNGGAIGTLTTDGAEFRVCGPLYHPGNDGRPLWINGGLGSREPVAEPKVEVPAYWAVEYDAKDVKWFLDGGFCLYGKLGNGTGTRIGGLIAEEKRIAQLMASIWREEMTLPKKLPPLTFDEDENSTE